MDSGEARQGFVIVRGINPIAKGALGDVLGYAKEIGGRPGIAEIGIHVVDGETIHPNTWYDIQGKRRKAG